ncbi:MAG: hypothetical protein ACRDUV_04810 [Pseudonocardiaceae bacterium]
MNDHGQPVLYAIVTGSPAARDIGKLVQLAQGDGWDVCVIASPNGYRFIDADILAAKTDHTVRHQYKEPDAPDAWQVLLQHPWLDLSIVKKRSKGALNAIHEV